MSSIRLLYLATAAAWLSLSTANPASGCYSYGVDFIDEGNYFINSNLNESFTCVSTFQGCSTGSDPAEILFIDPNNEEYVCSEVQTTPDNTSMISTCPFRKNQMLPGHSIILVFGNNGGGEPFAWQRGELLLPKDNFVEANLLRDLYLTVGPQATTTYTPTVTFTITSTPIITSIITSTLSFTSTISNSKTVTISSKSGRKTRTVTPAPVYDTKTKTVTRTRQVWTKELSVTTQTSTATCNTPAPWLYKVDKSADYSPTMVHPAALETSTIVASTAPYRIVRKSDRAVPVAYARARIDAAKARRARRANQGLLAKRAADLPTITVNAATPVNATVTVTTDATTTTESTAVSSTQTITLSPVTVYAGGYSLYTAVTTLPTPTKTRMKFIHKTIRTTKTYIATFTKTAVVTPSASVEACKNAGGYFDDDIESEVTNAVSSVEVETVVDEVEEAIAEI